MPTQPTPTGRTGEMELDQFNQQWRSSPAYAEALQSVGAQPGAVVRLTDQQREGIKRFLIQKGVKFESGMEIDPAGNFNQNEGFGKQAKRWGPILGAAAITLFGVPGVLPGVLNAGGAAAGAGGAAASGAATGAGAGVNAGGLGSWLSTMAPVAGGGTGMVAPAASGAGGAFGKLASTLSNRDVIGAAGNMLSAGANNAAYNRGVDMSAEADAAQIRLAQDNQWRDAMAQRAQEGRTSETDAWKKNMQAEYVKGRTEDYQPKNGLPSYGFGPKASTAAEIEAATLMGGNAMNRLRNGNPIPEPTQPTPFDFQTKRPGAFERLAGVAGPGLSFWGGLSRLVGR